MWRSLPSMSPGQMVEVPDVPSRGDDADLDPDPPVAEVDPETRRPGAGDRVPQGRFAVQESLVRAAEALVIEVDCVWGWTTSTDDEMGTW